MDKKRSSSFYPEVSLIVSGRHWAWFTIGAFASSLTELTASVESSAFTGMKVKLLGKRKEVIMRRPLTKGLSMEVSTEATMKSMMSSVDMATLLRRGWQREAGTTTKRALKEFLRYNTPFLDFANPLVQF